MQKQEFTTTEVVEQFTSIFGVAPAPHILDEISIVVDDRSDGAKIRRMRYRQSQLEASSRSLTTEDRNVIRRYSQASAKQALSMYGVDQIPHNLEDAMKPVWEKIRVSLADFDIADTA